MTSSQEKVEEEEGRPESEGPALASLEETANGQGKNPDHYRRGHQEDQAQ